MLRKTLVLLTLAALAAGCGRPAPPQRTDPAAPPHAGTASAQSGVIPRPDHVVIVLEENRGYDQIIGSKNAPYINQLAKGGALLTDAHGVTHPSQPNYLALFSGSTQGLTDDSCPHTFNGPNLAAALKAGGFTFAGYSESLPAPGFTGCESGPYRRKHNPWVNFTNVEAAANLAFSSFPADYSKLPTVSFVVPNLDNDMHDGSIATADQWLKARLDGYAAWAKTHNSLLIVTWDEDEGGFSRANRIPTLFVGAGVKPGTYGDHADHYSILRTIEAMYGLPAIGTGGGQAITAIWQ